MAKPTVWDEKFNLHGGALLLHCFCTQLPTSRNDWLSNWIACTILHVLNVYFEKKVKPIS